MKAQRVSETKKIALNTKNREERAGSPLPHLEVHENHVIVSGAAAAAPRGARCLHCRHRLNAVACHCLARHAQLLQDGGHDLLIHLRKGKEGATTAAE